MEINNKYISTEIFTTEGLFEVAIESWPEWDLNPQPSKLVQMLQLTELSGYIDR